MIGDWTDLLLSTLTAILIIAMVAAVLTVTASVLTELLLDVITTLSE